MRDNTPVIVQDTINDIVVGYRVGWYLRRGLRHWSTEISEDSQNKVFHNIRDSLVFETFKEAEKFRDSLEGQRQAMHKETIQVS